MYVIINATTAQIYICTDMHIDIRKNIRTGIGIEIGNDFRTDIRTNRNRQSTFTGMHTKKRTYIIATD